MQFGEARGTTAGGVLKEKVARGGWVGAGQGDVAAVAVHAQRVDTALTFDDEAGCASDGRDGIDEGRAPACCLRINLLAIPRPVQVRAAMTSALIVDGGVGERRQEIFGELAHRTSCSG